MIVAEFTRRVREALGGHFREVRLFGSAVRGLGGPESDIDLLVLLDCREWALEKLVSEIAFDVGLEADRFLSPCVYGEDEIADPILRDSPFVRTVLAEGLRI